MSVAIITGASGGLGHAYINAVLTEMDEITEIWIISRNKQKLVAIAEKYSDVKIIPIALDLTEEKSLEVLNKVLEETKPEVSLLINNAGIGKIGDFYSSDIKAQIDMIKLNIEALTGITGLVIPYMTNGSAIVNISSVASFDPIPNLAVYAATKSYVSSFTAAIREELKPRGINALYVCPGPMDTGFNEEAGINETTSKKFLSLPKDDPESIANNSLVAALDGKPSYVGKNIYKIWRVITKVLPNTALMKLSSI
jgi:short-subunit dehydrogenase